jgi:hypothetical protein
MVDGEGVWRSQKLRQVEIEYRAEYANLLPLAEDRGSFECDPASIWADVYAYNRPDIKPEDVDKILADFERVKLLFRWEAQGKTWGFWVGIDKAGLLPKPSERHSDAPVPEPDALAAFMGVSAAPEPLLDRADSAALPRTGFGFGVGVGSGSGVGDSNSYGAVASPAEPKSKAKSARPVHDKLDSSAFNLMKISQIIENSGHGIALRADDPSLPILVTLTEEYLARYTTPLDTPDIEGGFTPREAAASVALSRFQFAMQELVLVDLYIPIAIPCDHPGDIGFKDEDFRAILKASGWPRFPEGFPWEDMSLNMFAAILHWAFKESDYWPKKLKTLDDTIRRLPKVREQYEKFYRHLPEGKKPHDLGIGWPEEEDTNAQGETQGQWMDRKQAEDEGDSFDVEAVADRDGLE